MFHAFSRRAALLLTLFFLTTNFGLAATPADADRPVSLAGQRLVFGLEPFQVTAENMGVYGLKSVQGVIVAAIIKGSPASTSGIKVGDVILEIAGRAIYTPVNVLEATWAQPEAGNLKLLIWRNKKRTTLTVEPIAAGQFDAYVAENTIAPGVIPAKNRFAGAVGGLIGAARMKELGLTGAQGVIVTTVDPPMTTPPTGLQLNDVVLELSGTTVSTPQELTVALMSIPLAATIEVVVWRNGARQTLKVEPIAIPGQEAPAQTAQAGAPTTAVSPTAKSAVGIQIAQAITPELIKKLGLPNPLGITPGALVAGVVKGLPGERAGLKANDLIIEVSGKPIVEGKDFIALVGASPVGTALELNVWRNGTMQKIAVTTIDVASAQMAMAAAAAPLAPATPSTPGTPPVAAAKPAITAVPPAPASEAELLFWQSIMNSKSKADYEAYLQTYPNGQFQALARSRAGLPPAPVVVAEAAAVPPAPTSEPAFPKILRTTPNLLLPAYVNTLGPALEAVKKCMGELDAYTDNATYRMDWSIPKDSKYLPGKPMSSEFAMRVYDGGFSVRAGAIDPVMMMTGTRTDISTPFGMVFQHNDTVLTANNQPYVYDYKLTEITCSEPIFPLRRDVEYTVSQKTSGAAVSQSAKDAGAMVLYSNFKFRITDVMDVTKAQATFPWLHLSGAHMENWRVAVVDGSQVFGANVTGAAETVVPYTLFVAGPNIFLTAPEAAQKLGQDLVKYYITQR